MIIDTDSNQIISALIGGVLIGVSVTIMLWLKGVVTGISGITYNLLMGASPRLSWRLVFLLGLLFGGLLIAIYRPESMQSSLSLSSTRIVLAGLLVGFGTVMGNGCTSGHGVCGISRFSLRSITATLTFIISGSIAVLIWGSGT